GSSINRQWYIGNLGYARQVDQAIDYVRARYYAMARGRFLAPDPLQLGRSTAYFYAANAPAGATDPSGLKPSAVILGFDDSPFGGGEKSPGSTVAIMDMLRDNPVQKNIKGAFFVIGKQALDIARPPDDAISVMIRR